MQGMRFQVERKASARLYCIVNFPHFVTLARWHSHSLSFMRGSMLTVIGGPKCGCCIAPSSTRFFKGFPLSGNGSDVARLQEASGVSSELGLGEIVISRLPLCRLSCNAAGQKSALGLSRLLLEIGGCPSCQAALDAVSSEKRYSCWRTGPPAVSHALAIVCGLRIAAKNA